jgi:lycopene cyclase domain-containing protein
MTYLGFLAVFLGGPLLALAALTWADARRQPGWFARFGRAASAALFVHVLIALAYTTPWDNYLVATGVWWYDPARVLGVTLGWVPLEEYLFFALQPLVAGLLVFALARRLAPGPQTESLTLRVAATAGLAAVWAGSVWILASGWRPGTYLALELAWALPPIGLQLAVGADTLWRRRRGVLAALLGLTLYLSAADTLAIGAGVWTIDPAQSLNLLIGGVLPVEEAVFFLLTNTLLVFGLTLSLAPETWARWVRLRAWARGRRRALAERRRPAAENA